MPGVFLLFVMKSGRENLPQSKRSFPCFRKDLSFLWKVYRI